MADIYYPEDFVFDQLRVMKFAHDSGFLPTKANYKHLPVSNHIDEWYGLEETILLLLSQLYDSIDRIAADEAPEYEKWLKQNDYDSTDNIIILRNKVWGKFYKLFKEIESKVERDEFEKLQKNHLSSDVISDYINSIINAFKTYAHDFYLKGDMCELIMLIDQEFHLINIDTVYWSYHMLEFMKEKIPKMKEYLKYIQLRQSA